MRKILAVLMFLFSGTGLAASPELMSIKAAAFSMEEYKSGVDYGLEKIEDVTNVVSEKTDLSVKITLYYNKTGLWKTCESYHNFDFDGNPVACDSCRDVPNCICPASTCELNGQPGIFKEFSNPQP
jgi:hypothetical protein